MTINKLLFHEICEYLGSDLDSAPCKHIRDHMEAHPNCEVYVDKIRKTIEVYRQADQCDKVPEKVAHNLMACLKLDDPTKTCEE